MKRSLAALRAWIDDRAALRPVTDKLAGKTVPVHRYTVLYYFGGMTLFFFTVQVVTGILLMLYYRPSAAEAFESVEFIMTTVPFGWLIRSLHSWSANLMVYFACVHLASVFFLKAYRPPREITWISGAVLLFIVLGFGFSGYLLPWNQLAFFATKVGTDIAGAVPIVGEWMVRFLRGGDHVTGATLSRFYGWHVAILPAIVVTMLIVHLLLVQIHGMSVPPGREKEASARRPMKFFPHFALREVFGWTLALAVLATLAALLPWELGEKADPFAPAFKDIRPEWYFMFMFETLKLVPGGEILGIEYEAFPILFFGFAGLLLVLVPFFDRDPANARRSRLLSIVGWVSLVYIVGMTAWGYRSWLAVWIVLATAVIIAILALGTRRVRPAAKRAATRAPLLVVLLGLPLAHEAGASGASANAAGSAASTSCMLCHGDADLFDAEAVAIVERFSADVHRAVGLSCHDCHGGNGDPALAEDLDLAKDESLAENPYRGAPSRAEIPGFCGRCHSDPVFMRRFRPDARVDQEKEYWTSRHGQALAAGDSAVATCTDCHGVHGIRRPSDPASTVHGAQVAATCDVCHGDAERMAGRRTSRGLPMPTDQFTAWRASVHAASMFDREDLSAPTCNDCHGNHGASPPGLASVAFVCGQCHGREAELFRASEKSALLIEHDALLADAGDEGCAACHEGTEPAGAVAGVHGLAGCAVCHGNHAVMRPTVAMLAPLPETPCAFCHESPDLLDDWASENEATRARFTETRNALVAAAAAAGLDGSDRFDHLVEQARRLPQHTVASEDGSLAFRPEFARLFDKFRIGTTRVASVVEGQTVLTTVRRCSDCHARGDGSIVGFATAEALLDGMHELTVQTARAERISLRARRGGVETRDAFEAIDQAVDAQIQLEVLLHAFDTGDGSVFAQKKAEGLGHAEAALAAGREAIAQLGTRRRGLFVSLVASAFLMIGVGLKIRELSAREDG